MSDITDIFAAGGALAQTLPAYQPRDGQIEMARQVEAALAAGGQHVFEAGTGIGKTFAYLTPIIQSGMTALISTGARALQDQLSQRDIPLLTQALGRPVSLAVLKGRANYICRQALESGGGGALIDSADSRHWQTILHFAAESEDGDIRGIKDVPAKSPLLTQAVSTRDSCQTQKCPHYERCFLYQARARAMRADIVIVNHHLFLSDMRLRDEGVAELLPSRDVVLFDEAHLLPQLAPQFFSEQFSTTRLQRLLAEIDRLISAAAIADSAPLAAAAAALRAALPPLLEQCEHIAPDGRTTAARALASADWRGAAAQALARLAALARALAARAAGEEKIARLAERAASEQKILERWLAEEDSDRAKAAEAAAAETEAGGEEPPVRWLDYYPEQNSLLLHSTPMTGRTLFAKQWEQLQTVLFTSATLSVGGDFRDFCELTGLDGGNTRAWDSPYDFAGRSLLYLPPDLPSPGADAAAHTRAVVSAALPLIRANGGRAFVLFSSWRALNDAHDQLLPLLAEEDIDILKQGEMPNDELLRCFRAARRAVLLGSQSFWQGVDVRGEALSLVVVDKIPFIPPTDPLLQARDEWRRKNGENPFMRNQLPPAVILMKQVAGRLIRDYADYGVLMIGDPRARSKPYGKIVLNALPPMPRCFDGGEAAAFLRRFGAAAGAETAET